MMVYGEPLTEHVTVKRPQLRTEREASRVAGFRGHESGCSTSAIRVVSGLDLFLRYPLTRLQIYNTRNATEYCTDIMLSRMLQQLSRFRVNVSAIYALGKTSFVPVRLRYISPIGSDVFLLSRVNTKPQHM